MQDITSCTLSKWGLKFDSELPTSQTKNESQSFTRVTLSKI